MFAAAGCNGLLGLDETHLIDASAPVDAVGCSGVGFTGPTTVTDLENIPNRTEFDPFERADQRELWFSTREVGVDHQDLFVTTRASATAAWGPAVPFPGNAANADDDDPTLSADGLHLIFHSSRGGSDQAYEATRTAPDQQFGTPVLARGVSGYDARSVHLSLDGRTLYFSNAAGDLHVTHRATVDDVFIIEIEAGSPRTLATQAAFFSVSPDERELFYVHPNDASTVRRRVRADTTHAFDPAEETLIPAHADPEISADSRRLYVDADNAIQIYQRECN